MVAMNSPGVYVQEIDASEIVPSVSNSVGVFGGNFTKGQVGVYTQITSVDDLIEYYGKPTNDNYNDFYQCYNFLQYGNNLLVSRAVNINGNPILTKSQYLGLAENLGYGTSDFGISQYGLSEQEEIVVVSSINNLKKNDVIGFSDNAENAVNSAITEFYYIVDVFESTDSNDNVIYGLKLDRNLELPSLANDETVDEWYTRYNKIFKIQMHHNGSCEALASGNSENLTVTWKTTTNKYQEYENDVLVQKKNIQAYNAYVRIPNYLEGTPRAEQTQNTLDDVAETVVYTVNSANYSKRSDGGILFNTNTKILNAEDFEYKFNSLSFATSNSKLKFFSKTPGTYDARYKIGIALPRDFSANDKDHIGNHCTRYAYNGLTVDSYFEFAPNDESSQIAVFIYDTDEDVMKEYFLCSLDPDETDSYGNSLFIEKVINRQSNCVYVKCNTSLPSSVSKTVNTYDDFGAITGTETITVPNVESYTLVADYNGDYKGYLLSLECATDSPIQADDLLEAYEVFENKEKLDIDIIIGNELDDGLSAKNLAETRGDCIAFLGIPYSDNDIGILAVSKKSAEATSNIIKYRNKIGYNSMFVSLIGNYKYQYDRYNDTYRWLNVAGDVAGLRAQTTENFEAWYASAGMNNGQIKNVTKLAYNPNKTQIGTLYTSGINSIVNFNSDGVVLWGQKTMQTKASSFDRVNVRALFNVVERSLAKMSRYQVMQFNDTYTRNSIVTKITPYLESVKAGRGIVDFKVVCDTTNNTPDVISRNQLIVDVYIKPNYVAEYILLKFTNVGVNDFNTVVTNA